MGGLHFEILDVFPNSAHTKGHKQRLLCCGYMDSLLYSHQILTGSPAVSVGRVKSLKAENNNTLLYNFCYSFSKLNEVFQHSQINKIHSIYRYQYIIWFWFIWLHITLYITLCTLHVCMFNSLETLLKWLYL